jgi:hypothetical protein
MGMLTDTLFSPVFIFVTRTRNQEGEPLDSTTAAGAGAGLGVVLGAGAGVGSAVPSGLFSIAAASSDEILPVANNSKISLFSAIVLSPNFSRKDGVCGK